MRLPLWRNVALEIWLPIVLVLAWWFGSLGNTSFYFPSLQAIMQAFVEDWLSPAGLEHLAASLTLLIGGYLGALIVGVVIGTLLGRLRRVEDAVRPVVEFLRAIPGIALLPIFVLLLGIGVDMKILLIAYGAFWPVLLNTIDGVRSVEPDLLDVARVFRLGRTRRLFSIILPSASPQIFAGARTALSIAVIVMIVAETVGADGGIGYFLLAAQRRFDITSMWGAIVALGILGYVLNIAFRIVEAIILRWHRQLQSRLEGAPA